MRTNNDWYGEMDRGMHSYYAPVARVQRSQIEELELERDIRLMEAVKARKLALGPEYVEAHAFANGALSSAIERKYNQLIELVD